MIIPIRPWLNLATGQVNTASRSPLSALRQVAGLDHSDSPIWRRPSSGGDVHRAGLFPLSMDFYHDSIMSREIVAAMQPAPGKQIFDGTLGGGGHSELFLQQGSHVIGCDQDQAALEYACRRLEKYGDSFLPVRGNFRDMDRILADQEIDRVDGILLDLGVSSRQLDDAERGFSFREVGPLDMRMDDRAALSAREIVNEWPEEELVRIFREYGEERHAGRAARAIVKARGVKSFDTTLDLAGIVEGVVPKVSGKHPATRIFQALRIAVNRELESLAIALEKTVDLLAPGGVLAVLSFHSLEDRIVKRFLHHRSRAEIDRPEWAAPQANPDYVFHLPSRKALSPSAEEMARNPRSRSALLRVALRI